MNNIRVNTNGYIPYKYIGILFVYIVIQLKYFNTVIQLKYFNTWNSIRYKR